MARFRKKPIVIEAVQWPLHYDEWPAWLKEAWQRPFEEPGAFYSLAGSSFLLSTLEGQHIVSDGDYIIKGIANELYPCKADIFAATYDPVE